MDFDVVVIGSGPGGYFAAIRAAQLGAKVACIEKGEIGGVCLNAGCIPTKTLIASVEVLGKFKRAKEFGITTGEFSIDFPAVIMRKVKIVRKLQMGISSLFKSHKIEYIKGTASFTGSNSIDIKTDAGNQQVNFKKCIIATGSKSMPLPGINIDGQTVITSTELLNVQTIPASLVVIGGGVIGVEFASLFNRLGTKVTIIELLPKILMNQDDEISVAMTKILKAKGVEILTGSKLTKIDGKKCEIAKPDGNITVEAEKILICVGRKPSYDGLGLEKTGIQLENNRIKVNEKMETNVPGIYAIGDAVSKYMLAYVASAEGIVAAENASGKESFVDYNIIPSCIFTSPEVGSVGLTEAEALNKGYKVKVGRFPFIASGRAAILDETEGMVKVIADESTGQVLGVHIIGPEATEIIHTPAIAMKMEVTTEEFQRMLFCHPVLSEAVLEAVHDVNKEAIDLPKKA